MSRIGKKPIPIPSGVKVAVKGLTVSVEGPKGKLSWTHREEVSVRLSEDGKEVVVERKDDERISKSLHGLTRTLVSNMIEGCLSGYTRSLEVYGVGYGVQVQGSKFTMQCGFSHPVVFEIPAGVKVEVQVAQARGETEPARFTVSGPDKQLVGELAASIYRACPPEPYKGKGVRFTGEHIRRKVGKALAGAGG